MRFLSRRLNGGNGVRLRSGNLIRSSFLCSPHSKNRIGLLVLNSSNSLIPGLNNLLFSLPDRFRPSGSQRLHSRFSVIGALGVTGCVSCGRAGGGLGSGGGPFGGQSGTCITFRFFGFFHHSFIHHFPCRPGRIRQMLIPYQPRLQIEIQRKRMINTFPFLRLHQHGHLRLYSFALRVPGRRPYFLCIKINHHCHGPVRYLLFLISQ